MARPAAVASFGTWPAFSPGSATATRRLNMSLFAWLVLGLLAGFIASYLVNHRGEGMIGEGMILDILLGIVGAIVGGWVFHLLGLAGVTRLNLYSLQVAVLGSVVFLVAYHAIRRNVVGRRYF
jgi:uncharacterized membrane protein YeaQ/YmgE (transglycosylase-associated protein family)